MSELPLFLFRGRGQTARRAERSRRKEREAQVRVCFDARNPNRAARAQGKDRG